MCALGAWIVFLSALAAPFFGEIYSYQILFISSISLAYRLGRTVAMWVSSGSINVFATQTFPYTEIYLFIQLFVTALTLDLAIL